MKKYTCRAGLALGPILLLAVSVPAQATSTDVTLNLEGNPTCSSLGPNDNVLEYRDNSPPANGVPRTVEVVRQDGGTQLITYTMGDVVDSNGVTQSGVTEWSVTGAGNDFINPINYTIIKSQGGSGARVFHFGGTGEVVDTDEAGRSDKTAAVSFCYGLTVGFTPPDEGGSLLDMTKIPNCEDLAPAPGGTSGETDLFTTGIRCPVGPGAEKQLILNFALDKRFMGFNFEPGADQAIRACTCNVTLPPCNPDLPLQQVNVLGQYLDENGNVILDENGEPVTAESETLTGEERACLEYGPSTNADGIPNGVNQATPFEVKAVENPDSYICTVIGGKQYCWGDY